jgi:hypothetical protein
MLSEGFEPIITASERLKTNALDRTATGIGDDNDNDNDNDNGEHSENAWL